jgi:hypothetical protein
MLRPQPPSYDGHGLVNLIAELEHRLIGSATSPRLEPALAETLEVGNSVVLVLFDGLGSHQLGHPAAANLAASRICDLDAPFPSTTTVSLATVATGLAPSQHGIIAYKMWMPEVEDVVNTIHMTRRSGGPAPIEPSGLLPSPNLWERLSAHGVEPIVVQPGNFANTPLTQTLYRGARFEGYWDLDEAVDATVDLAATEGRLVFLYVPHVDFAAHMAGQESSEYASAMADADRLWDQLSVRLGPTTTLVGTADHGHVDIGVEDRQSIDHADLAGGFVSEDGRVLFVHGDGALLATRHGGLVVGADDFDWWGPDPRHPSFDGRTPDQIVFLPAGTAVFDERSNSSLVGYHGSLEQFERRIPVLVRR